MSFLTKIFSNSKTIENPLSWDMHNHVLNQIDDDDQSEIVINNFKEKYPNSTTYSLRFIAEDIEAPIVSTMARKFPESRLHVLHVSTVPTQDGTYAKMTLQVIGNEDLQKAVREHLDSTYNVTMEVI